MNEQYIILPNYFSIVVINKNNSKKNITIYLKKKLGTCSVTLSLRQWGNARTTLEGALLRLSVMLITSSPSVVNLSWTLVGRLTKIRMDKNAPITIIISQHLAYIICIFCSGIVLVSIHIHNWRVSQHYTS